ncbi:MAG: hypothetical protein RQ753_09255 [Desulfurivibrionaceae bacterium]|nr:hypothetical protein [Desulfobulbales bacterium]MDT8335874.1 hypothetical protein [Desulfurivibrionaceae bacterium]
MAEGKMLDIAHISFLDMIKVMITMSGAAAAKGTLIRNAISTAEKIREVDYPTLDDFLAAIEDATNPITQVEGKATHQGEFVFGLAACPFAPSIGNYTEVFEKLPDGYADFTAEFNKPSKVTDNYRVGEGAGVSPFCSVHQPMRSAIAERIKIGGKKIKIYQLGCKAGSGKKGFAEKWLAETGISQDVVDKVLDNHMCCYYLKIVD